MSVSLETGVRHDMRAGATRGIGLAIINPAGELWVQRDVGSRSQTGRSDGQRSIPFETQKLGEPTKKNVLGALPEVINDAILPKVQPHLHTTDGLSVSPDQHFAQGDKKIVYGLAVVVYDGPEMHFQPHVTEEAEPFGWMQPKDFLEEPDFRPLAEHAVGYMLASGLVEQKLWEFEDPGSQKELVIPEGFVVADFHEMRELTQDMVPGFSYTVPNYG